MTIFDKIMRNSTETTDHRIITAGGFAASFLVGFVTIRYAQRRGRQWLISCFKRETEIQIDSGKEGIQPKHNLKPKFFQVT